MKMSIAVTRKTDLRVACEFLRMEAIYSSEMSDSSRTTHKINLKFALNMIITATGMAKTRNYLTARCHMPEERGLVIAMVVRISVPPPLHFLSYSYVTAGRRSGCCGLLEVLEQVTAQGGRWIPPFRMNLLPDIHPEDGANELLRNADTYHIARDYTASYTVFCLFTLWKPQFF
jgi:hypothetical protein